MFTKRSHGDFPRPLAASHLPALGVFGQRSWRARRWAEASPEVLFVLGGLAVALVIAAVTLALRSPPVIKPPTEPPPQTSQAAVRVEVTTNKGVIVVELDAAKAPASVANFLDYVDAGHYAGTIFHRVVKGFVIQGGGFTETLAEKPTRPPIANEAANGLKNLKGTIAMARTADPNSATAQFYINLEDNPNLDPQGNSPGYAVFGRVVQGLDVVEAIGQTPTRNQGDSFADLPQQNVVIESVRRM